VTQFPLAGAQGGDSDNLDAARAATSPAPNDPVVCFNVQANAEVAEIYTLEEAGGSGKP
jgi:hypothetical protein